MASYREKIKSILQKRGPTNLMGIRQELLKSKTIGICVSVRDVKMACRMLSDAGEINTKHTNAGYLFTLNNGDV